MWSESSAVLVSWVVASKSSDKLSLVLIDSFCDLHALLQVGNLPPIMRYVPSIVDTATEMPTKQTPQHLKSRKPLISQFNIL